jgi:hypothetical protein
MTEIETIRNFVLNFKLSDAIPEMEDELETAIGYSQRVGEMISQAEYDYRTAFADALIKLQVMEEETETTRKAKLESWTAEKKMSWQILKNLNTNLKAVKMSLMQAIKTRREEPH